MKKIIYTILICVSVFAIQAQTYLVENFNYSTNDSLNSNGWVVTSGAVTNAIRATATGLTYTGYMGSGIGTAAALTTSGQDVCKDGSVSMTNGSVYSSFLMNVAATQIAGDYFYGFLPTASTSNYYARVFLKSTSTSGYFFIGISKYSIGTAETPVYSIDSFTTSTTYLIVLKYQFNTVTTADDSVKVFVFSSGIPSTEPASGKAATIGGTNADAANLQRVFLRQGSAANAPTLTVDGIRFGAAWGDVALPVNYTSFSASKSKNAILLTWATASETNNDHFEIEKSLDDINFKAIGKVKGAGDCSKQMKYSFTDKDVQSGTVYYRLKQVDKNGNFTYSKVVTVKNITKLELLSSPNPVYNELNIQMSVMEPVSVSYEITNIIGKVYHSGEAKLISGNNTISIDANSLPAGVYFIRTNMNGETNILKIIKQ